MPDITLLTPERIDIAAYRGDTFRFYWNGVVDELGAAFDWTGGGDNQHTALFQVRSYPSSPTVLQSATTPTGLVLAEAGEIAAEIDLFLQAVEFRKVYYDLQVADETGDHRTLFYGTITLTKDVSR